MPDTPETLFCPRIGEQCAPRALLFKLGSLYGDAYVPELAEQFNQLVQAESDRATTLCTPKQCGVVHFGGVIALLREASITVATRQTGQTEQPGA